MVAWLDRAGSRKGFEAVERLQAGWLPEDSQQIRRGLADHRLLCRMAQQKS